jgi:hypothetical protein
MYLQIPLLNILDQSAQLQRQVSPHRRSGIQHLLFPALLISMITLQALIIFILFYLRDLEIGSESDQQSRSVSPDSPPSARLPRIRPSFSPTSFVISSDPKPEPGYICPRCIAAGRGRDVSDNPTTDSHSSRGLDDKN